MQWTHPHPFIDIFRFGLTKRGSGGALGFGHTHTHIAKYRSSPNASKKPSPRRFKHDSLAQRLNPDKHTQSCTPTRIHTLTDRETETNSPPSTTPNASCPQSRFAREVDSISGVERVDGHKTKRWQFFVHFLGVCPFNCWVVWSPPPLNTRVKDAPQGGIG